MRGEDLVGNMRLMGLGDPPYPEDQFVAKVSTPPVPFIVRRAPAAATAQYSTSQQQLAAARLALQQRAQQQAQQQAEQQRYQQQAEQQRKAQQFVQIVAANMAAKTILDAAKSVAASHRAEAVPVAVSAGAVQSAASAQAVAQGASQNSANISVSIQSRAPEPQVEDWRRYIIAPRPERDLADIKREMDLNLAISRQAETDRAYAAQQQQTYEPTYIEIPWVAKVFGGQSAPSGVSTQLPDVAGEIVELPDLPQAIPSAASTQQQAYRPIYTTQDRQQIEQEFNQKFGVPVEPMFNLFGLAKTREQWAKEYQWKYGERAPETAEEMRVALLRKGELDAKVLENETRIAAESAAKNIYAVGIAPIIEKVRQAESDKQSEDSRILSRFNQEFPAPLFGLFQTQKQAYESKYGLKFPETIEEKRLALQNSSLLSRREAEVNTERLAEYKKKRQAEFDADRAAAYEARKEAEAKAQERWDKTPEIVKKIMEMTPEQYQEYFGESIRDINKRNYINANLDLLSTKIEEAATSGAGIYDSGKVAAIRTMEAEKLATKFDQMNPVTDKKFPITGIDAIDAKLVAHIRRDALARMSPAFVTDITPYSRQWGDGSREYTADSATRMVFNWAKTMLGTGGIDTSQLASFAKKFVEDAVSSNIPSIKRAYTNAASSAISSQEREKRMIELARTLNAFSDEIVMEHAPRATEKAGLSRLVDTAIVKLRERGALKGPVYAGGSESGMEGYTWVF